MKMSILLSTPRSQHFSDPFRSLTGKRKATPTAWERLTLRFMATGKEREGNENGKTNTTADSIWPSLPYGSTLQRNL